MLREFTYNLGEVADHLAEYQFTHEWDKFAMDNYVGRMKWIKWSFCERKASQFPLTVYSVS